MSIVTDRYNYANDPVLRNWARKEYLQRDRWDSRLQSLIPPNFWYFDPEDKRTWFVYTPCQFFESGGKAARYIILVRWWSEIDPRGFFRMYRTRGWLGSSEIRYYDRQEQRWLEGKERKEFVKNKLEPRLQEILGIKKLSEARIRRYRFNFGCYYTGGDLRDRDGHHNVMDNPIGADRIRKDLIGLYDYWLLATDDRTWNIIPINPEEHRSEHINQSDHNFKYYRELKEENESSQWNQETGFNC